MSAPTVEEVLEQRRLRGERLRDRWATLAAVGLHALAVTAALVLPLLTAETPERPRILPVRLVPLQRMGRPDAPPEREVRTQPQRPEPEPPKPEPPKPEPKPEPPKPQAAPPPEPTPEPPRREPEREPEPREPERAEPPPSDSGRLGSPQGDPLGTSAFGARIAGVDPGFTYDSYLQRMLSRIESEWRRPGVEGVMEAVIHFVVDKDGTVRDLHVLESSGHRPFDLAAVRAVQNASPLPPLPRSYRKDSLGVNLIVR